MSLEAKNKQENYNVSAKQKKTTYRLVAYPYRVLKINCDGEKELMRCPKCDKCTVVTWQVFPMPKQKVVVMKGMKL